MVDLNVALLSTSGQNLGTYAYSLQKARPISDISTGTWTPSSGSDLYAMLDEEIPSDIDFIQSSLNPDDDSCEVKLDTLIDSGASFDYTLYYRINREGLDSGRLALRLMEGSVEKDHWELSSIPTGTTTCERHLSQNVIDSLVDHSNLRVRAIANASQVVMGIKVHETSILTKANADTLISFCVTNHINEIYQFAQNYETDHYCWLAGSSAVGNHTSGVIVDGHAPMDYLIEQAHANNIKVYAWIWMYTWSFWGGTTGLIYPDLPDSPYKEGTSYNFHDAIARTKMVDTIEDLCDSNPMLDGIVLGMEVGYGASTTIQDMTDFMTELRAAIPGVEICVTVYTYAGDQNNKLDIPTWLDNDLIDTVHEGTYYWRTMDCVDNLARMNLTGKKLVILIGSEINQANPSDVRFIFQRWIDYGYDNFGWFSWDNNLDGEPDYGGYIKNYMENVPLDVTQAPITSVTVTPGGGSPSFSLVVDGVTQTTLYSAITDHTASGPLKAHVEADIGSENPAVIYYRSGSTWTVIMVGDRT